MRRLLRWGLLGLFVALWGQSLSAAGTATVTATQVGGGSIRKFSIAWTSDGSGNVSGNAFSVPLGHLLQAKAVPGTAGDQPSNEYDVTLVDTDGVDVLSGGGADLSNSSGQYFVFQPGFIHEGGTLDLRIANAGSANAGTFVIWVGP